MAGEREYVYINHAIPFFVASMVIEALLGALRGKRVYRVNDTLCSVFLGIYSIVLPVMVGPLLMSPALYISSEYGLHQLLPASWDSDGPLATLGAFLVIEYAYYWLHRMGHEWAVGWAAHSQHHSSEDYNLSTALRQAALKEAYYAPFLFPAAVLFRPHLYMTYRQLNNLYQFWIHTKLIGDFPYPFNYIFVSPSHHRTHHGRNPVYIDKNYGGTLIVFDRLHGTYVDETEEVVFGLTHHLGTFNPWLAQFAYPWHLVKQVWRAPWRYKLAVPFRGPGWRWDAEEEEPHPAVDAASAKMYDVSVGWVLSGYLLVQLIGLIALSLVVASSRLRGLVLADVPPLWAGVDAVVVVGAFVLAGCVSVSGVVEHRAWSIPTECLRLAITVAGVWALGFSVPVVQACAAAAGVSAAVLLARAREVAMPPTHTFIAHELWHTPPKRKNE